MATGRLLIILLIGCIITSCTKEVITIIDIPKEEGKASTISLQINLGSEISTRSGWVYDEYFPSTTPTSKEDEVSNVLLVIFKNILLEEYVMYETKDSKENGGDFSFDQETGVYKLHKADDDDDEIDLDPGLHYFYAILNIPDGLYQQIQPILENGKYTLLQETFEKQLMDVNLEYLKGESSGGNGFIMTNSNPPQSTVIYSDTQCEELGLTEPNKVTIPVGRALAKVSLAYVPAKTGELHGHLENIEYKTVNHPSRMYLMPVKENGILMTPHYTDATTTSFLYPIKDALNSTIDQRNWLTATTRELKNTPGFEFDFDYCIENNVKKHLKSNSTGLLIRAKFVPKIWINTDDTVGEEKETDGTFWRIGQYDNDGYLLTYTQGYYNEKPSDSKCAALGTGFKAVEYKEGRCYYAFWLTTSGEHLVKRNDFHRVVITHIHGAGAPDIGDIIYPDVDPDPLPTYGTLFVYAIGWDEYFQEETLGEKPVEDDEYDTEGNISGWEEEEQKETLGSDNNFN